MMLRGRLPVAALIGVFSRASNQIITVVVTLVATRFLSPTEFGSFAAASAFLILGRNLLYTGPFEYLLRASKDVHDLECLIANMIVAITYSIISVICGILLFSGQENQSTLLLLCVLILSVPVYAYTAWLEALILREGYLNKYYACTLLTEIAGGAIIVLLFYENFGIGALVLHLYLKTFVLTLLYKFYSPRVKRTYFKIYVVKEVIYWSYARFGSTITQFFSNYGSDLILASLYAPSSAGVYRASNRIVTSIYDVFNQPMRTIIQTSTSRNFAKGLSPNDQGLIVLSAFACVAWPGLITLALLADDLIPYILGPDWAQAAPIVVVFASLRCLTLFDGVFSANLVAYGKQKSLFFFQVLTCFISIIAIVVFLPLGTIGAAVASMSSAVILTLIIAIESYKIGIITIRSIKQILFLPLFVTLVTSVTTTIGVVALKSQNSLATNSSIPIILLGAFVSWCLAIWMARRKFLIAIRSLR